MMRANFITSSLLTLALALGVGATSEVQGLNVPATPSTESNPWHQLSRALYKNKLLGRDTNPKNSTDISKSWNNATLLKIDVSATLPSDVSLSVGVEVTCVTCYVKGLVTGELSFGGDFNISHAIANFTEEIGQEIKNITDTAIDYLEEVIPEIAENITDFHWGDISLPPLNNSFNFEIPEVPECRLQFQLDDLELYLMMDTVLSAGTSYTLNLYSSNTPIGFSVDSGNFFGFVVDIDLILSVDTEIDISHGLHLKIDDGTSLDLALFSHEISNVTFNGGSFQFLPVSVQTTNGVLKAKLRVSLHAGVSLDTGTIGDLISFSTGAGVMAYADLAEFTTNITAVTDGDDDGCEVRVQQYYQLALGAAAGATLAIQDQTWGPDPSTKVPIFYTTMADACGASVTKTVPVTILTTTTPAPTLSARADEKMTTTTLKEEVTFTGILCLASSLAECPASLQTLTKIVSTKTSVFTVPSGSKASFPPTTYSTIPQTITLERDANRIAATTGTPVSYVPPKPTTTTSAASKASDSAGGDDEEEEKSGGGGVNKALIIGLSVGLGVPFLIAVTAALYFCVKRRQYAPVARSDSFPVALLRKRTDESSSSSQQEQKPMPTVTAYRPDRT